MHHQGGNALLGQAILRLPSKAKGLVTMPTVRIPRSWADVGHDRGSAGAGAAAHTGGDKDHLRTLQGVGASSLLSSAARWPISGQRRHRGPW